MIFDLYHMPDVFVSEDKKERTENTAVGKHSQIEAKPLPFLASFCENPKDIAFVNQEEDEKIILFLRRHFIKNLTWISTTLILLIIPIFLITPFNILNSIQAVIPLRFIIVFLAFYYLIIIGFIYTSFVNWFYNIGIITTKQIIDIDFTDIMYREVAKARIEDVIDVEYIQGGFLHSFFDYGNVFVQTEGIKPNFEFQSTPRPDRTADIIIDLKGGSDNE